MIPHHNDIWDDIIMGASLCLAQETECFQRVKITWRRERALFRKRFSFISFIHSAQTSPDQPSPAQPIRSFSSYSAFSFCVVVFSFLFSVPLRIFPMCNERRNLSTSERGRVPCFNRASPYVRNKRKEDGTGTKKTASTRPSGRSSPPKKARSSLKEPHASPVNTTRFSSFFSSFARTFHASVSILLTTPARPEGGRHYFLSRLPRCDFSHRKSVIVNQPLLRTALNCFYLCNFLCYYCHQCCCC